MTVPVPSAGTACFHERLRLARGRTDELFSMLDPAALYERPVPERHRLVFYLGHLEAFDWNLVGRYALGEDPFHSEFDKLFAFGIDPAPGKAPSDKPSDWPSATEIRQYNQRVRQRLDRALELIPDTLLHVAIEHRLMHAETFSYLLHELPAQHKHRPGPAPDTAALPAAPHAMVDVPAGDAVLGQAPGEFGWDNEFDRHTRFVPAFRISKYKVTNREYLEFVEEGGDPSHFWRRRSDAWFWRGMFGEVSLPLDAPVYVTYEQASAYARWKGAVLPAEAQWHRAAEDAPWNGNSDFAEWDPVPVNATPENKSVHGVEQINSNGWEWTSTVFGPFAGFRAFDFYPGYSQPFFDGQHFVLKGGSPRTAACFLRPSFRNWFRPNYPYVYAGFRLVES